MEKRLPGNRRFQKVGQLNKGIVRKVSGVTQLMRELVAFVKSCFAFLTKRVMRLMHWFERFKSRFAGVLYKQRGRWARPFSPMSCITEMNIP